MTANAGEVIAAARTLAAHDLVDAFGHVSARDGDDCLLTPPRPLGSLAADEDLVRVPLAARELPPGAPEEAWCHLAIYKCRPDVGGICRAQPEAVNGAAAAGVTLRARHGQGAFLGSAVPVHDDARLVRDPTLGEAVAAALGGADAVVLRGNGALAVGSSPGFAAALIYVMEVSARINLAAATCGGGTLLTPAEIDAWRSVAPELLRRLWDHLVTTDDVAAGATGRRTG